MQELSNQGTETTRGKAHKEHDNKKKKSPVSEAAAVIFTERSLTMSLKEVCLSRATAAWTEELLLEGLQQDQSEIKPKVIQINVSLRHRTYCMCDLFWFNCSFKNLWWQSRVVAVVWPQFELLYWLNLSYTLKILTICLNSALFWRTRWDELPKCISAIGCRHYCKYFQLEVVSLCLGIHT